MKNILLLTLSVVMLTGCDRMKLEGMSKVRIQMPAASNVANISQKSELTTMGFDEDRAESTGFASGGVRNINCYIVAAGGPEAAMQRNTCMTKPDANGASAITRKIGLWAGAFPAGAEVSLDVPSGKDRYMVLMGFYAAPGDCKDMRQGDTTSDSSPIYYLGESNSLELAPGATQEVPVTMAFDVNKKGDCEGPDFPSGNNFIPTQLTLEKNNIPANAFLANSCDKITIRLKDNNGRYGSAKVQIAFSLDKTQSSSTSAIKMYETQDGCNADTGGTAGNTSLNINSGNDMKEIYIKPTTTGTMSFQLANNSTLSHSAQEFTVIPSTSPTPYAVNFSIPDRVLPGICYPVHLMAHYFSGNWYAQSNKVFTIPNRSNIEVHGNGDCTNLLSNTASTDGSSAHSVKFIGTAETGFIESNLLNDASANVSNKFIVHKGYGDTTPVARLMGPMNVPLNNCAEYQVMVTNSNWTPLPNALSAAITVNTAGDTTGVFVDAGGTACANVSNYTYTAGVAAGQYSQNVILRFATVGQKTITLGSKTYTINVQ